MTAAALIAEARELGIQLFPEGERVRFRGPHGALTPDLQERLRAHKAEILATLKAESTGLLDDFLADGSIPTAIFHSQLLNRDFVLARDRDALKVLTEDDQQLPVIFFSEAEKILQMGLDGVRVLLDFRKTFGPSVALRRVSTGPLI